MAYRSELEAQMKQTVERIDRLFENVQSVLQVRDLPGRYRSEPVVDA